MRASTPMARAMRPLPGVQVRQDFVVEGVGDVWDPLRVPIVLNSFNRLTYLRRVVDALKSRGYSNLYVIDNASTYQPLLDYYASEGLRVFHLDRNVGYLALWTTPVGVHFTGDYYVYSDSDIEPAPDCPADFVARFREGLDRDPAVGKVGFGLRIDDLPESYALRDRVIEHEKRVASAAKGNAFYPAAIDTTMALYRPSAVGGSWLPALRTAAPYVARHLPWYEDSAHPSAEERFYLDTIATSTHWSLRGGDAKDGVLEVPLEGQMVRVVAGPSDDLWNVVSRGEWRPEVFELIDAFVDGAHTVLEVGAGPGPVTLYAAGVARRVYALEPDRAHYEELRRNVALNGWDSKSIEVLLPKEGAARTAAPGVTLAQFFASHDLSLCKLVSVDPDGREWRFLPDLIAYLRSQKAPPTLAVTLRPGRARGLRTSTPLGKGAIAVRGLFSVWRLLWALRFYRHVYDAGGNPIGPLDAFRLLSSRITVVASDHPWPGAPALSVR